MSRKPDVLAEFTTQLFTIGVFVAGNVLWDRTLNLPGTRSYGENQRALTKSTMTTSSDRQGQRSRLTPSVDFSGTVPQWGTPFTVAMRLTPGSRNYTIYPSSNRLDLVPTNDGSGESASYVDQESPGAAKSAVSEITIDFDKLPKPSILGSFLGDFTEQTLRSRVIEEAARLYPTLYPHLGRPPTQQEAETLAEYTAAGYARGSIGPTAGTTLALLRASLTSLRGEYFLPLPFRQPGKRARREGFDPQVVKIAGRELLRGQTAVLFHRSTRAFLYGILGYGLGTMYAHFQINSSLITASKDPRMADIVKAVNNSANEMRERIRTQMSQAGGSATASRISKPIESDQSNSNETSGESSWGRNTGRQNNWDDDASPTGGSGVSEDIYAQAETVNADRYSQATSQSEGRPGDERFAGYQERQRGASNQPGFQGRPAGQGNASDRSGAGGSDFWSDSNSQSQARSTAPTQASGSAWDRLRAGKRPSNPSSQARSNDVDDVSPQAPDNEQTEAQKEFDAMLDRERSGTESSRRW